MTDGPALAYGASDSDQKSQQAEIRPASVSPKITVTRLRRDLREVCDRVRIEGIAIDILQYGKVIAKLIPAKEK